MAINKEQTESYYQNYEPCSCTDCKNYSAQIKLKFPLICEYLESLGIDPKKPFELIPIDDEKGDTIDYICQYVVFGSYEGKTLNVIDGVEISVNEDHHPETLIEQEHFVIDFGSISLPKKKLYFSRHIPLDERVDLINHILYKIDPIGLAGFGCPKDEYMLEAREIARRMNTVRGLKLKNEIFDVFKDYFDTEISKAMCSKIVNEIHAKIDFMMSYSDLKRSPELKNLEIIDEYNLKLVIHKNFVVTTKDRFTYINGKLYYDIEEQEMKESFIDFVNNSEVVYIQHKKKPFSLFDEHYYGYFVVVPKKNFNLLKYIKNKNVELIFTNREVLFSK